MGHAIQRNKEEVQIIWKKKRKKGRVIAIPADHEKSFEEEIEEGRREWDKRIEEFSQLGHEFYKTRHGEELAAQEKLIGLKAIENYLEVQLVEIHNEIKIVSIIQLIIKMKNLPQNRAGPRHIVNMATSCHSAASTLAPMALRPCPPAGLPFVLNIQFF